MESQPDLSDTKFALIYWQATITFGRDAVNAALAKSPWQERFPNTAANAAACDVPTMRSGNDTVLPGELVYEIAGQDDLPYGFFISEDQECLYSSGGDRQRIAPCDALLKYGAYAMFYSVDNLYGMKGQRNPMLR